MESVCLFINHGTDSRDFIGIIWIFLLLLSRQLQWLYHPKLVHLILTGGMMILAIPTIVLAVGLFLWLQDIDFQQGICL